jgi:hypothetical protein
MPEKQAGVEWCRILLNGDVVVKNKPDDFTSAY